MTTDLHAPLGQNRKDAGKAGRIRKAALTFSAYTIGIAAIAGVSAYSALVPQNLHDAAIPAPPPAPKVAGLAVPSGQKTGAIPQSGKFDGANVQQQLMDNGMVVTKFSPKNRDGKGPLSVTTDQSQNPRMAGLPNDELLEDTPQGRLPKTGANGLRPFDFYARPWSGARGTRIAIIVSGLGISQTGTMRAVRDLPEEVTLAFAANGNSLQRWVPEARRNGHEVLLQVPMEPFDYPANNPGQGTLVSSKGATANLTSLRQDMARMDSYTGVMNYLGGKFLSDPEALEPVMREMAARGLMFLDDGTTAQSLSGQMASALSMPHAFADMTLDSDVNQEAILKKLDDLERLAMRKGSAVGVAAGFDESIAAIKKWMEEAQGRGIEIVGVSALADAPQTTVSGSN